MLIIENLENIKNVKKLNPVTALQFRGKIIIGTLMYFIGNHLIG